MFSEARKPYSELESEPFKTLINVFNASFIACSLTFEMQIEPS